MANREKIGLITFISNNYGTCLQAYAMRKAIEGICGKDSCRFINFVRTHPSVTKSKMSRIRRLFKMEILKNLICLRIARKIGYLRNRKFKIFQQLILTDEMTFRNVEELRGVDDDIRVVVCGSDMVWSPEYASFLDVYLLTWCTHALKVSYAPSIGNIEVEDGLRQRYQKALTGFYRISCREKSGVKFIESITKREVSLVTDPTLLFDANQWLQWFPQQSLNHENYILVYCFGGIKASMRKYLKKLAESKKLAIRFIFSSNIGDTVRETKYGDGAYGPAEFVKLFSNAAFTVVNGYHGLLFSLIFEKPFVLLHRRNDEHWGVHENRMSDILEDLHLGNRYVQPESSFNETLLKLDYTEIRERIQTMRKHSWDYLKEALS